MQSLAAEPSSGRSRVEERRFDEFGAGTFQNTSAGQIVGRRQRRPVFSKFGSADLFGCRSAATIFSSGDLISHQKSQDWRLETPSIPSLIVSYALAGVLR